MKYICLIFSRLIEYYKSSKLIFILYIIGSVTCSITLIYFYGNSMTYKTREAKDATEYKIYSFNLQSPENPANLSFNNIEKYGVKDILLGSEINSKYINSMNQLSFITDK